MKCPSFPWMETNQKQPSPLDTATLGLGLDCGSITLKPRDSTHVMSATTCYNPYGHFMDYELTQCTAQILSTNTTDMTATTATAATATTATTTIPTQKNLQNSIRKSVFLPPEIFPSTQSKKHISIYDSLYNNTIKDDVDEENHRVDVVCEVLQQLYSLQRTRIMSYLDAKYMKHHDNIGIEIDRDRDKDKNKDKEDSRNVDISHPLCLCLCHDLSNLQLKDEQQSVQQLSTSSHNSSNPFPPFSSITSLVSNINTGIKHTYNSITKFLQRQHTISEDGLRIPTTAPIATTTPTSFLDNITQREILQILSTHITNTRGGTKVLPINIGVVLPYLPEVFSANSYQNSTNTPRLSETGTSGAGLINSTPVIGDIDLSPAFPVLDDYPKWYHFYNESDGMSQQQQQSFPILSEMKPLQLSLDLDSHHLYPYLDTITSSTATDIYISCSQMIIVSAIDLLQLQLSKDDSKKLSTTDLTQNMSQSTTDTPLFRHLHAAKSTFPHSSISLCVEGFIPLINKQQILRQKSIMYL